MWLKGEKKRKVLRIDYTDKRYLKKPFLIGVYAKTQPQEESKISK